MDRIELELIDGEIAITIEGGGENMLRVRRITARDALVLGLLLTSETPELALNIAVRNGVTLQIENWPYTRAWLGIDDGEGGRIVACLEDGMIRQIGQCLHGLYLTVNGSPMASGAVHILPISYCYLDDHEPRDETDLLE